MITRSENVLGRDTDYLKNGIEFYITGRFAFLNKFQSSGVIFHQAFECIMKGGLIKHDRAYWNKKKLSSFGNNGHSLEDIMEAYSKACKRNPAVDVSKQITNLDHWYRLRYPVFMQNKPNAILMTKQFKAPHLSVEGEQNLYILALDGMDGFFKYLSETWPFDPFAALPSLNRIDSNIFFVENPFWSIK